MDTSNAPEEVNARYGKLKSALIEIATILEKFPETLRPKVFDILLGEFYGKSTAVESKAFSEEKTSNQRDGEDEPSDPPPDSKKGTKTKKKAPDSFSIDPDLALHGGNGIPSFVSFVNEKKPHSNAEFNTVAVYYLVKHLKKPKATLKELWTCYKDAKRRTPDFFRQSLTDTKNKTGNIKIDENFDIEISSRGENLVEHDLPPETGKVTA